MIATALYAMPTVLIGMVVIAACIGMTGVMLLLIHRLFPLEIRHAHNDVVGFIIAVVGVIYAVTLAFVAVTVWEDSTATRKVVYREADLVSDVVRDSSNLPEAISRPVQEALVRYLDAVVKVEWPDHKEGARPEAGLPELRRVHAILVGFNPATPGQEVIFGTLLPQVDALFDARRERIFLAVEGVDPVVWAVLLLGGVALVSFTCLFGLQSFPFHLLMAGILSFSIGLVMVMVVLDQPLRGEDQISPDPYLFVMEHLKQEYLETADILIRK
jgi:hypothetical protein